MPKLELTVMAETWKEAEALLISLGLTENDISNHIPIEGLFLVSVQRESNLIKSAYKKIEKHKKLAILSDSTSQEYGQQILGQVYQVELLLRRLLLHISDSVESYFDVLQEKASHHNGVLNSISKAHSLDVATSHLTLGQMIEILPYDTAPWSNKKDISPTDLLLLLKDAKQISGIETEIERRMQPRIIWDVISQTVLAHPVRWDDIKDDLSIIRRHRDTAAHFRIVRQSDSVYVTNLTQKLLSMIVPKTLTPADIKKIREADKNIAATIQNRSTNGGYPPIWDEAPIDTVVDTWGMYNRESVSYAAYRVAASGRHMPYWGGSGNANQWPHKAKAAGIQTGTSPRVGSVAILPTGYYGHAMWVEEVYDDGSILVSHYNSDWNGRYRQDIIQTKGITFIYF